MTADPTALDAVLPALRCPVCEVPLQHIDRVLTCAAGHSFDLARQGYVNLLARRAGSPSRRADPGTGDSARMVAARDAFLGAGHYRPISAAVADAVARELAAGQPGIVLDLAGGTGQYLAVVLDRLLDRSGLVVDLSKPALQRAARVHPRVAAVGADAWARLPLAGRSAAAVLNVFGPRNGAEIARVLAPGGVLVSVTPNPDHLRELVEPLGMLRVDDRKAQRLALSLPGFAPLNRTELRFSLELDHQAVADVVGMGPTADHVDVGVLAERIAGLTLPIQVTAAVQVNTFVVDHPGA